MRREREWREKMEPSSSRAEAERWLVIAEKLLTARDLIGSKTFAIRARESDPSLEHAELILAVADTLLAGERRINNQHNWYAILQLVRQTHDSELIAAHCRRLALLLNPNRNKLPFSDEAFKLVSDAWSVLSSPSKKSAYDNELSFFSNLDPAAAAGSSRAQEIQEQEHHYNQQQQASRQSPKNNNIGSREKNVADDQESEVHYTQDETSSFWTACPYCYNMYEYPSVYEECTLRCQNCRRAFQALVIPSPPSIFEGKEAYYCCWGFFPLGVSTDKNKSGASTWVPFSPMFACPQVAEGNVNAGAPKSKKSPAPRIYIDDPDVFVEVSDPSDDSDDVDWGTTRRKKKSKRGRGSAGKHVKKLQVKGKNVKGGSGETLSLMQEGRGVPNTSNIETNKKAVTNNAKKQTGKAAKDLGKLDLNVELSNEVEEPVPGMSEGNGAGHGEEDGSEGTEFFEGLDEFLSSLPILSVVGDDKVKAA